MKPQKPLPNNDDDFDPRELEDAADETPATLTPPELDANTKDLIAWDEPPSATGKEEATVPPEDESQVPEKLVYEGAEEADRVTRMAAADPDFEP